MSVHSPGHVGVVVSDEDQRLLFCGDHMQRVEWFEEDYAAGRMQALQGFFYPGVPVQTRPSEFTASPEIPESSQFPLTTSTLTATLDSW